MLHPEAGDFILETDAHHSDWGYLKGKMIVQIRFSRTFDDCGTPTGAGDQIFQGFLHSQ
jgi:hypothetical protein